MVHYFILRITGYNFKKILYFFSEDNFVLANSADPDEMQHNAAFHLGLHFLPKYPFWVSGLHRVNLH